MDRVWIAIAALAGLSFVAMQAALAHVLAQHLDPPALASLRSAVEMQGWHAAPLALAGLLAARGGVWFHLAGAAFTLGLILFCGTLYAETLAGMRPGPLVPAGGLLLMAGWASLGIGALARPIATR